LSCRGAGSKSLRDLDRAFDNLDALLIFGRPHFEAMQDLVHVAIILVFVLLSVGFVRLCDRI